MIRFMVTNLRPSIFKSSLTNKRDKKYLFTARNFQKTMSFKPYKILPKLLKTIIANSCNDYSKIL